MIFQCFHGNAKHCYFKVCYCNELWECIPVVIESRERTRCSCLKYTAVQKFGIGKMSKILADPKPLDDGVYNAVSDKCCYFEFSIHEMNWH